ncbi:MAG: DUF459 domain-containing protein [Chloroflexi bacterium]|nr:DUF459 domain-containing protein [Chloroflexota bacterium]
MSALEAETPSSPTTSIWRVLLALAICLLLAVLLDARGIVHSASGMPDGPMRTASMALGRTAVQVAALTHLDWPWDRLQSALGREPQPAVPPLLASALPGTPRVLPPVPTATPLLVAPHHPPRRETGPTFSLRRAPARRLPKRHVLSRRLRRPVPHLVGRQLRRPTPRNPLRLLITGDSLPGYLGPELLDEAASVGPVRGWTDTHNGTGLTRPDFVDWSVVARQQIASYNPDAVVVLIGGNDFQNMTLPGGRFFLAGSPAWTREYQRRAEICMRIWTQNGTRRLYWLSVPPARDPGWAHDDLQINLALQHAARRVPGAEYLDILGPITNHGRYADFVYVGGQPVLVREPDGVHLNIAGSTLVAHEILPVLRREWHF